MTTTFLTLALLLPAAPVPAPKTMTPKGPPPRIVVLTVKPDGTPCYQQTRTRMVPVQRSRQVLVGQQVQTVTETVMVSAPETVLVPLDGEGVEIYGGDGKKIEAKDVRKRVTKSVAALMSVDGKRVDPFYLRLARTETLVIVMPPAKDKVEPKPKPVERIPVKKR